jgi:hypothetical protein
MALRIDGLLCADQFAGTRLAAAGLITASATGLALTSAGRAAISSPDHCAPDRYSDDTKAGIGTGRKAANDTSLSPRAEAACPGAGALRDVHGFLVDNALGQPVPQTGTARLSGDSVG